MIDSQYIHKIYVLRYTTLSNNTLGEPLYSSSVYVGSGSSTSNNSIFIPARVEEYNMETQYRESNLRPKNSTIIYVPPQYSFIRIHDEVHFVGVGSLPSRTIGIVTGINQALRGLDASLDHIELTIENP